MARYDIDATTLGMLLDDPEVVSIIDEHAPGLSSNPMIAMATMMPASQALTMAGTMIGMDKVETIRGAVTALE